MLEECLQLLGVALERAVGIALDATPLRCGPHAHPMYSSGSAERYDRNACSTARAQEPIELLARWPNGMVLARTRYALVLNHLNRLPPARGFMYRNYSPASKRRATGSTPTPRTPHGRSIRRCARCG